VAGNPERTLTWPSHRNLYGDDDRLQRCQFLNARSAAVSTLFALVDLQGPDNPAKHDGMSSIVVLLCSSRKLRRSNPAYKREIPAQCQHIHRETEVKNLQELMCGNQLTSTCEDIIHQDYLLDDY
jgi:hypothetical protein